MIDLEYYQVPELKKEISTIKTKTISNPIETDFGYHLIWVDEIKEGFGTLAREAMSWIREDQGFQGEVMMVPSADMRYRGQSYEIDTQLEASWIESGSIDLMAKAFHELHEKIYEHSDTEAEVQLINLRMVISGKPPKPNFPSPRSEKL